MKSGFPHELRFHDEDYLDHESWIRYCFDCLGDIRGRNILDYGCGAGFAAVVLARRGASVSAFDLAPAQVALTRARTEANGVENSITVEVMAAEDLRYPNSNFHAVYGNAILHHVDLAKARSELHRVMSPGAIAVFAEPFGENFLLEFARSHLPYPGKLRSPDEYPLKYQDIAFLAQPFEHFEVREFQLISMIRRVIVSPALVNALERLDGRLIATFPSLRRFCRYIVIQLRKGKQ